MFADTSPRDEESIQAPPLTLLTTASTPVTPGPSTPTATRSITLEQLKVSDIIPPTRPSSTPFPKQDLLEGDIQCSWRESGPILDDTNAIFAEPFPTISSELTLCNLPTEIHECILDHLFGVRASASARNNPSGGSKVLRGWNSALRHSRRREVSELALVSNTWRHLIQDRLYRHLKIKGTRDSINQATLYFAEHPHLCSYIKHIEFWFPVFQQKNFPSENSPRIPNSTPERSNLIRPLVHLGIEPANTITYQTPSNNCSLEEIFRFVQMTFGEACILTLEGGERKKPPMVQHFRSGTPEGSRLPTIDTIRTLVCKGQWNLIRSNQDFQTIADALPMLNEWHGSYAKPKSKAYLSMATILPHLPQNLTHLNICLEGDYRRESMCPSFFRKVGQQTHFCIQMARSVPTLEYLVYTGRVCHSFFDAAAQVSNSRTTRLKSVDLVVKNCCRPSMQWNDGSGITDIAFIAAFESLVTSGVRSLERLAALEFLRIRFIDLESQAPPLNPYFQMEKGTCTGIWSEQIINALTRVRPEARFLERSESLGDVGYDKDGRLLTGPSFLKYRPLSIKVSSYLALSPGGITIN
ncbi:hypothetical protein BP5796_03095 [Coleophoma crateriformis]|uniref:Uncharacterized protein n=1 Tax=Coleophoma crateriformis TaxID=565419 RepID=A0A3D8SMJ0_9HELO|nr:hypothetical protein BP5796_03095 [Coleophoma crateriformis]